jgi:hypothetical protein
VKLLQIETGYKKHELRNLRAIATEKAYLPSWSYIFCKGYNDQYLGRAFSDNSLLQVPTFSGLLNYIYSSIIIHMNRRGYNRRICGSNTRRLPSIPLHSWPSTTFNTLHSPIQLSGRNILYDAVNYVRLRTAYSGYIHSQDTTIMF